MNTKQWTLFYDHFSKWALGLMLIGIGFFNIPDTDNLSGVQVLAFLMMGLGVIFYFIVTFSFGVLQKRLRKED